MSRNRVPAIALYRKISPLSPVAPIKQKYSALLIVNPFERTSYQKAVGTVFHLHVIVLWLYRHAIKKIIRKRKKI